MQLHLKLSLNVSLIYTFLFIAVHYWKNFSFTKWECWGSDNPKEHSTSKSLSYEDPLGYGPTILYCFPLNSEFYELSAIWCLINENSLKAVFPHIHSKMVINTDDVTQGARYKILQCLWPIRIDSVTCTVVDGLSGLHHRPIICKWTTHFWCVENAVAPCHQAVG